MNMNPFMDISATVTYLKAFKRKYFLLSKNFDTPKSVKSPNTLNSPKKHKKLTPA